MTPPGPTAALNAPEAILIGASTGGPSVLGQLLQALPHETCPPVVIVQHISAKFAGFFANHLERTLHREVVLAREGMVLAAGTVYIAPGDRHLTIEAESAGLTCRLTTSEPLHGCRPAVDALFSSCAKSLGHRCIAIVLTGIGRDGTSGARALRSSGASVLVQDEDSSVAWGMPGSIAREGLATEVMNIHEMGRFVQALLEPGHRHDEPPP